MKDKLDILKMVASNEISPDEALSLLDALDHTEGIDIDDGGDIVEALEEPVDSGNDAPLSYKNFDIGLISCRLNVEKSNVDDVTVEILDAQTRAFIPKPEWLYFSEEGDTIYVKERRMDRFNDVIDFIKNSAQIMKSQVFINIKLPLDMLIENAKIGSISGNLSLIGIDAHDIALKTVSGQINVMQVKVNRMMAKTTAGSITVDDVKVGSGQYTSTSGKLKVYGSHQKIKLKNVSGGIRVEDTNDVANVYGQSVSGKLEVYVKSPEKYNLSLETMSGKIDTSGFAVVEKLGSGKKIVKVDNRSRGHYIELNVVSGTILLDAVEGH
jgi:hypothetical protein